MSISATTSSLKPGTSTSTTAAEIPAKDAGIYGIHLDDEALEKIYYKNAARILGLEVKSMSSTPLLLTGICPEANLLWNGRL